MPSILQGSLVAVAWPEPGSVSLSLNNFSCLQICGRIYSSVYSVLLAEIGITEDRDSGAFDRHVEPQVHTRRIDEAERHLIPTPSTRKEAALLTTKQQFSPKGSLYNLGSTTK